MKQRIDSNPNTLAIMLMGLFIFSALISNLAVAEINVPATNSRFSCNKVLARILNGYLFVINENTIVFKTSAAIGQFRTGLEAARIEFEYSELAKGLMIEWIEVQPHFQNQGLSHRLIANLLKQFPQTILINAYLTNTNIEVFNRALQLSGDVDLALKATPFYRSFAQLGFSEIIVNHGFDNKRIIQLKLK